MAFFLIWAALQIAKPEKPLDPKDARSVAEHSIFNSRSQERIEATFSSRLKFDKSDPFIRQGKCVWAAPGVLALQSTGSGGQETNVLRAGADIWVYVRIGDEREWVTAATAQDETSGRGLENPEEILSILSKHAAKANFGKQGLEISFTGQDLAGIVRGHSELDCDKSSVTVTLELDPDSRLKKISLNAALEPKDLANPRGSCTASIEVLSYNGKGPIRTTDAKGKEIAIPETIRKAMDSFAARK